MAEAYILPKMCIGPYLAILEIGQEMERCRSVARWRQHLLSLLPEAAEFAGTLLDQFHGDVSRMTQMLMSHGCFGVYLYKIAVGFACLRELRVMMDTAVHSSCCLA